MNHGSDKSTMGSDERGTSGRRAWSAPRLVRLGAREAEGGANPLTPEGQFATGS